MAVHSRERPSETDRTTSNEPSSTTSGVIVAGGFSERFGDQEKALVPVDGKPMLARVGNAVAPAVDELVINCRAEQRPAFERALEQSGPALALEVRFALDRSDERDQGPVAGLRRGLEAVSGTTAVAVPCDLALLEAEFVAQLVGEYDRVTDTDAVVPYADDYSQLLCAVYDVAATQIACERVLETERRRLFDVLDHLAVTTIDDVESWTDPRRLRAIDTPDALAACRDEY
ncbi:molybdenum cofactor guanylyltransferase [Natrarchaeobius halalkaliphilus]|uniref:Molybdenum cofactor guanylyltransferase n=1 Tax=Natrarchaeobius halalkaliphilus TaxID=1679091 RepID=A0A3N6M394_9EURY|nr:molybdenum cofactor guanylyltransferase [Natrarchaeobius halalkaliphilus]RQG86163.1 molybdenum cofactor guanylyltransferase [Natrarchaeobius halalkaliphilus]